MDVILCIHHDIEKAALTCILAQNLSTFNYIMASGLRQSKYVQEAVRICESYVAKHLSKVNKLLIRADNPFKSGCCPELDVFPVLELDEVSY